MLGLQPVNLAPPVRGHDVGLELLPVADQIFVRTSRGLQPPPDGLTVGGRSSAPEGKVTSSFAASASISFVRASW